jgi:hypothetical protein
MQRAAAPFAVLLLALTSCQTVAPGTPTFLANCDAAIREFAKIRPGALNSDEWAQLSWTRTRRMDRNGDGKIDKAEWVGTFGESDNAAAHPEFWAKGRESLERSFDRADRDHRGYLERSYFLEGYARDFQKRDRNHDGWVNRDECALSFPEPF